jgi:hypothetical protein
MNRSTVTTTAAAHILPIHLDTHLGRGLIAVGRGGWL